MPLPELSDIDLNGKTIMVTGGTGSFGRCFTKKILSHWKPQKLIIFSRDEMKQWEMSHDPLIADNTCMRFFIGDVRDQSRLEMAMRGVDYVIHAAALKHVSAAEYNPFECIHTNVLGAENVVQSAIRTGVRKVVALSTDKAASPLNLYGASKLASDKIFVAANNLSGKDGTCFSVVRYGNVLGSRGSVLPLFRRLIEGGSESLPITDPRMTRFWITLDQGVEFVLSCLQVMRGSEIFIPKIPSLKVTDLAKTLAPNLKHEIVGIRPGEKLHEVMVMEDDARNTVELSDRYIILPDTDWWSPTSYEDLGAKAVASDFSYASNTNSEWLDEASLNELLLKV